MKFNSTNMGNVVDTTLNNADISLESNERLPTATLQELGDSVIDLDSKQYIEWLTVKRERESIDAERRRKKTGTWRRKFRRKKSGMPAQNPNPSVCKQESAQVTQQEFGRNSREFEKRNTESRERIEETRTKYKLKKRDYHDRIVLNMDDKKATRREKEERQKLRVEIRMKYQIPKDRSHVAVI